MVTIRIKLKMDLFVETEVENLDIDINRLVTAVNKFLKGNGL